MNIENEHFFITGAHTHMWVMLIFRFYTSLLQLNLKVVSRDNLGQFI